MYCLYHAGCLDGVGAAAVVKYKFPKAICVPVKYGDECPLYTSDLCASNQKKTVVIVDFSYARPILERLCELFKEVVVIDHHLTYETTHVEWFDKPKNFISVYDKAYSGAVLTWQHYFGNKMVPNAIMHIEDRDLWNFTDCDTQDFTAGLYHVMLRTGEEKMIDILRISFIDASSRFQNEWRDRIIDIGQTLNEQRDSQVKLRIENVYFTQLVVCREDGSMISEKLALVNSAIYQSELGHEICKKWPDVYAALVWYFDGKKYKISARSVGDNDVTIIAKQFGGGGHKNAAGFEMDKMQFNPIPNHD